MGRRGLPSLELNAMLPQQVASQRFGCIQHLIAAQSAFQPLGAVRCVLLPIQSPFDTLVRLTAVLLKEHPGVKSAWTSGGSSGLLQCTKDFRLPHLLASNALQTWIASNESESSFNSFPFSDCFWASSRRVFRLVDEEI